MTFQQELSSWMPPGSLTLSPAPEIGAQAPSAEKLPFPRADAKPVVVTFLRHCGCPFAEKTFRAMRSAASANPSIKFIAVSHSDQSATDKWLASIDGSGDVDVVVDDQRDIYTKWGLGVSGIAHFLSPWSLYEVYKLGRDEGIWNKPTESGSRWQMSGTWAVDAQGVVRWGSPSTRADDTPDIDGAVAAALENR